MATSLTAPSKHSRPTGTFRVTIASLLFVELFSGVLQVYFTPLYPALAAEFGVDVGTVSWALIAFTLAGGVSTPLFARLGDMYGHRRMLRVLLGVVALGSILIAVAPNFPTLLVGRVLQGAFPPFLPLMFGLMRSRFSAERTNRGIAYLSSILLFGLLVGSAATGLLVLAAGGPGWALWLPAIGTVLGFGLLFLGHTEPAPDRAGRRVDLPGALLLGLGLVLLLLGFNKGPEWGWGSIRILAPLVIGALVLVGWVVMELRVREPLADLRFLFRPQLVPVYVVGVSVYFGSVGGQVASSTFMALPTKLGYGLGLSGFAIGLVLLPILATAAVMALLTARLGRALGFAWVMTIGAGLGALGNVGLIFFHGTIVEFV
ncbi:MAG: MFS transporter, partial [Sciscionella sp.]